LMYCGYADVCSVDKLVHRRGDAGQSLHIP
jgi:hypothetical protein